MSDVLKGYCCSDCGTQVPDLHNPACDLLKAALLRLEAVTKRAEAAEGDWQHMEEQYQSARKQLDSVTGNLQEAQSRLDSYRQHSIVTTASGSTCKICKGWWSATRGAELHEDWCPNHVGHKTDLVVEKPPICPGCDQPLIGAHWCPGKDGIVVERQTTKCPDCDDGNAYIGPSGYWHQCQTCMGRGTLERRETKS